MVTIAASAKAYGKAVLSIGKGLIDLSTTTIPFKCALTTVSYVPNSDTHEFLSDVTNEITGTGYTAGGATLTTVVWAYDATNHRCTLTCDPVTWTAATFTARIAVVYKNTGTAGTSRLISYVDLGADQTTTATDFVLSWASGGLLRLNVV